MTVRILTGDCIEHLRALPADSVDCVVTSPPYWGLRDYGVAGVAGAIGLEPTLQEHIAALVAVFREARRVLKQTGTCWINYGDAYAGSGKGGNPGDSPHVKQRTNAGSLTVRDRKQNTPGLKPKDRMLLPARLAIALCDDGWWVRDEIIWSKPNPMPASVRDRSTPAHEMIYLLTKAPRYFFDQEAWKTPISPKTLTVSTTPRKGHGTESQGEKINAWMEANGGRYRPSSANKRSVWTVAPKPFKEAHFATFPPALIEPCILAGCPERVCDECGAPWARIVEKGEPLRDWQRACGGDAEGGYDGHATKDFAAARAQNASDVKRRILDGMRERKTTGFRPTCRCEAATMPGIVLDPFGGAGTTALVAEKHGRDAVLIELNPEYVEIAKRRIYNDAPLFADIAAASPSAALHSAGAPGGDDGAPLIPNHEAEDDEHRRAGNACDESGDGTGADPERDGAADRSGPDAGSGGMGGTPAEAPRSDAGSGHAGGVEPDIGDIPAFLRRAQSAGAASPA